MEVTFQDKTIIPDLKKIPIPFGMGIWYGKLSNELDNTLIDVIKGEQDAQRNFTNVKALMTTWNLSDKPGFDILSQWVQATANTIGLCEFEVNLGSVVQDMWGMIYYKDNYATLHSHWPAIISGVYYPQAPEGSSSIVFPDVNVTITPETNDIIFFPGFLKHKVEANNDVERISISWNIKQY